MPSASVIREILKDKNISQKHLSDLLGKDYQVLRNSFYRNALSLIDVVRVAKVLNCELAIFDNENGKKYIIKGD